MAPEGVPPWLVACWAAVACWRAGWALPWEPGELLPPRVEPLRVAVEPLRAVLALEPHRLVEAEGLRSGEVGEGAGDAGAGGAEAGVEDAGHDEPLEVGGETPRDALDTEGGGILGEAVVVVVGDEAHEHADRKWKRTSCLRCVRP